MNRKGEANPIMLIIEAIIVILVLLAFITTVANTKSLQTKKQTASNESISVETAYIDSNDVNESINYTIYSQSDWKAKECPLGSVAIRNGAGTALTSGVDYVLYPKEGVFSLKNTTKTVPSVGLNLTYADYTYCADGYLTSSGDRGIANLWVTLMVIALLGLIIGIVFKIWKQ